MLSPADFPELANRLIDTVRALGELGFCPATGGNFSARADATLRIISRSGRDKRQLQIDDLMLCDAQGKAQDPSAKASDEAPLHMRLYELDSNIAAVLHTHSVAATVLSRNTRSDELLIRGYEMQKALHGQYSHDGALRVRIYDNTQDIPALAAQLAQDWQAGRILAPGFLVRGHGLYAWGNSIAQAQRHIEGLEFLFACLWQEKLMGTSA